MFLRRQKGFEWVQYIMSGDGGSVIQSALTHGWNRYNRGRMDIDLDYLRRHYADLSDEALMEVDPSELVAEARRCYEEELARRRGTVRHTLPERESDWRADDSTNADWIADAT